MRKIVMLTGMVALLMVLFAAAALAVNKQCGYPCNGTSDDDRLFERNGERRDRIHAKAGDDVIRADRFSSDFDFVEGNSGSDRLNVQDGDNQDSAYGGSGFDICIVDDVSEVGGSCQDIRTPPSVVASGL